MYRSATYLAFITTLILSFSSIANAKDKTNATAESPLKALYSCSTITDSEARLACYDENVAAIHTAENKNEIIAIDAVVAKKIKREAFGFNLPSLPKLGLPSFGNDDKIEAQVFKVKSIRKHLRNHIITLENGYIILKFT